MKLRLSIAFILLFGSLSSLYAQGLEWTKLQEPSGTQIKEILVSSQNEVFIATDNGVFLSLNHGLSWEFNNNLLVDNPINTVNKSTAYALLTGAPDPTRQLLFVTSWLQMWWSPGNHDIPRFFIWGSSNGGTDWQFEVFKTANPTAQNGMVWNSPTGMNLGTPYLTYWSGGTLFLAGEEPGRRIGFPSQHFVVRSNDTGNSWVNSLAAEPNVKTIGLQNSQPTATTAEAVFALFSSGKIFKTLDTGNTWKQTAFAGFAGDDSAMTLTAKSGKVVVYSLTKGAFLSRDLGDTWKDISQNLPSKRIYSITIDQQNEFFAALPQGVFKSQDYGNTWIGPVQGLPPNAVGKLACDSSNILYACASQNAGNNWSGVYVSTDHGATWFTRNTGLPTLPIQALAGDKQGGLLASAYGGGVYRTVTNGNTWSLQTTDYALPIAIDRKGVLFVGTAPQVPYHIATSTDFGITWMQEQSHQPYSFAAAPDGSMYMSTMRGEIMHSTNTGATWDTVKAPPYKFLSGVGQYFYLGASRKGTLYAAAPLAIYQSKDTGRSWEQLNANLLGEISAMMVDSQDNIWIGMKDGRVTVSRNGGFSWTLTDIKSPMGFISCFLVTKQGEIFAATSTDTSQGASGVYRMTSNTSWIPINKGLIPKGYTTYPRIASLAVTSSGKIFAGSIDRGIFRLDPENGVSDLLHSTATVELQSVSPNPARVSSAITIDVKERQEVSLKVYDPLGRTVATLLDGVLESGNYTTHVNTSTLPAGNYLIRLTTKDNTISRGLVIIR